MNPDFPGQLCIISINPQKIMYKLSIWTILFGLFSFHSKLILMYHSRHALTYWHPHVYKGKLPIEQLTLLKSHSNSMLLTPSPKSCF